MKRAFVLVPVIVFLAGVSFGDSVGYQDFVLNMPKIDVIKMARDIYRANMLRDAQDDYQVLHGLVCEIGKIDFMFDDNDRLAKITILLFKENADLTIQAIHKKWGKPTNVRKQTYQNQFGAQTEGWTESWTVGENIVFLLKIPRTVKEATYSYVLTTRVQMDKDLVEKPLPRL